MCLACFYFKTHLFQQETKAEKWKSHTIGTESKIIGSDLTLTDFPGTDDDGSADQTDYCCEFLPHNNNQSAKSVLNEERISQNAQDDNIPQTYNTIPNMPSYPLENCNWDRDRWRISEHRTNCCSMLETQR